jgi:hypothetical protein
VVLFNEPNLYFGFPVSQRQGVVCSVNGIQHTLHRQLQKDNMQGHRVCSTDQAP